MTDVTKRKAVERARTLMADGKGLNAACREVAEQAGVTKTTILRWASSLGDPLIGTVTERSTTKNATAAKVAYDGARRLALIDKLLTRCEERLDDEALTARELPGVATALAIGIDKRRLEDGEATDRHDWAGPDEPSLERSKALRLRLLNKPTG